MSFLRRGHANLLCIVPILTDDLQRESKNAKRGCSKIAYHPIFQHVVRSCTAKKIASQRFLPDPPPTPKADTISTLSWRGHTQTCPQSKHGIHRMLRKSNDASRPRRIKVAPQLNRSYRQACHTWPRNPIHSGQSHTALARATRQVRGLQHGKRSMANPARESRSETAASSQDGQGIIRKGGASGNAALHRKNRPCAEGLMPAPLCRCLGNVRARVCHAGGNVPTWHRPPVSAGEVCCGGHGRGHGGCWPASRPYHSI